MKISNALFIALTLLFFFLGYKTLKEAKQEPKSQRIYQEIKKYSPYYLEKRIGGFQIMMKGSDVKEKPPITEVYTRLDQLDKGWGKEHISIDDNHVIIKSKDQKIIAKIKIELDSEKKWVQSFFQIK